MRTGIVVATLAVMLMISAPAENATTLVVDGENPHQELAGFGASFTESSAWNLACLPEALRSEILVRLFDPKAGMGFTLTRTHINSCDYSLRHYSYVEPGDLALELVIDGEVVPTVVDSDAIQTVVIDSR